MSEINFKILKDMRASFDQSKIIFMNELIERMYKEKPYTGLKVFYNAHFTLSSILQIEALAASGADLVTTCKPGLRCDEIALKAVQDSGVKFIPYDQIKHETYDIAIDCCGAFANKIDIKYGVSELTQTGVIRYMEAKPNYPVVSVDDSEIRKLKTAIGTGDGFIRGFHKITNAGIVGRKFVIIGYGKVGSGIAHALSRYSKDITVIEADLDKVLANQGKPFKIYHYQDKINVTNSLKEAYCIITATGVEGCMSHLFDRGIIQAKFLANMGSEDEWGSKFRDDEILNNKLAVNFCLAYPTQLIFMDPIFYAQLIVIDELLNKRLPLGLCHIPDEVQLPILSKWGLTHFYYNTDGDYFENILYRLPAFIYWKDSESVYMGCNMNFAKVAGLNSPEEIIGKTDYELPWGETEAEVYRTGDIEALNGKELLDFEETQLQADGSLKTVLANKIPFRNKDGHIMGVLGIYSDITDQKHRAELEKSVMNEQIRALQLMGSAIAHELRTPLAAINLEASHLGFESLKDLKSLVSRTDLDTSRQLQLMKQKIDELSEGIVDIRKNVISANAIIDLMLSNIQGLATTLDSMDSVSIKDCVENMLSYYPFMSKEEKALVHVDVGEGFVFRGVSKLIEHVLSNLLKNALFYIKSCNHGEIYISASSTEKFNILYFKDTGAGIKKEHLSEIFTNFFSKRSCGTGIGLGFCKQVMLQHNGDISCDSVEGEYTNFILKFPKI